MLQTVRNHKPTHDASIDPDSADVALARDGDLAAFERLYHSHVPRINSVAQWMLGNRDTDDVLQDVFLRAWQKLPTFRGEALFGTWLRQLAINVILRHRERVRTLERRFVADEDVIQLAQSTESFQLYTDVENAVSQLSPRARDVFVLHDVEGYKHYEIAEMLGISANTSRWQLHEARANLRKFFG